MTNHTENLISLRADAELKLEAWNALRARHAPDSLTAPAAEAAAKALDKLELAEGDEHARSRDLHVLRADLVALEADAAAKRETYLEAARQVHLRAKRATDANEAVAKRRAAAGQPFTHQGFHASPLRSPIESVDAAIAESKR